MCLINKSIVVFLTFTILTCTGKAQKENIERKEKPVRTSIAIITDLKGKVDTVFNLYFGYWGGGMWIGNPPHSERQSLDYFIEKNDSGVTTRDQYSVPFSEINSIEFEWNDNIVPPIKVEIEMNNNTKTIIIYNQPQNKWTIEERDSIDNVVKIVKITKPNYLVFSTGQERQGELFRFTDIRGNTKSMKGQEGDYSISPRKVQLINFLNNGKEY